MPLLSKTYRRINQTLSNPYHDKRFKYGLPSHNVFPSGDLVIERIFEATNPCPQTGIKDRWVEYSWQGEAIPIDLIPQLRLTPHTLLPSQEYLMDWKRADHLGLVQHLLNTQKITLEDVNNYHRTH
jgi:hypothetical protein